MLLVPRSLRGRESGSRIVGKHLKADTLDWLLRGIWAAEHLVMDARIFGVKVNYGCGVDCTATSRPHAWIYCFSRYGSSYFLARLPHPHHVQLDPPWRILHTRHPLLIYKDRLPLNTKHTIPPFTLHTNNHCIPQLVGPMA